MVTRGDSRISLQLAKNKYTAALERDQRFLIDDPDSPHKLAYILSKPLKSWLIYQGEGTYKFVLQEVTSTQDDNHELGIADYYKFFPKDEEAGMVDGLEKLEMEGKPEEKERKVWI